MAQSKKEAILEASAASLHKFNKFYDLAKLIIKSVTWVYLARYAYKAIKVLAGKVTYADIKLAASYEQGKGESSIVLIIVVICSAVLVGIIGLVYGQKQARLRKVTVERLTAQITTLEKIIDRGRTSSKLTTMGETSEEDKS